MVSHPILLRGLSLANEGARPTILRRTDQDFLAALLAELGQADGLSNVSPYAMTQSTSLKLHQPVHRTFHLALFEAVCDAFGQPRVDPRQIEGAGLVVRRRTSANGQTAWQGWMTADKQMRGWVALNGAGDDDPDPAQRPLPLRAGHKEIDRQLALRLPPGEPLAETTTPLFVAPPEVCAALGKTILYGLIPVTSAEFSVTPPPPPSYDSALFTDLFAQKLGDYWKAGASQAITIANGELTGSSLDTFKPVLHLLLEFDAFGELPQAKAVVEALNAITITGPDNQSWQAGNVFKKTASRFLDASPPTLTKADNQSLIIATLVLPVTATWTLTQSQINTVAQRLAALLPARLSQARPGENRFSGRNQRYHLRAFVRIDRGNGCPPELVWSEPSHPFTIAPWYETADTGLPPVEIALPDPTDRDALKQLKPNVSFLVPENLFNFLQSNNLSDLFDGAEPSPAAGVALDWICGFNIPIITLCAFIVLSIFLALLDIVFSWLLFIKICIPIPKSDS
jgi:hypothetical protein